jgi:hypothetical protein
VHDEVGRNLGALTSSLPAARREEFLRVILEITHASAHPGD